MKTVSMPEDVHQRYMNLL